ncbi:TetR/AcrR family transcriptional regulator [Dickeya dianthicola]|uniref:TetR/AcrR family transcriptional regulator n=1 Tax=Dickeya dianthicola TaxID=204039 RepID=UPI001C63508D|nr:TetR/AcrR family transcriptional regulator [Dickeya dianthicola]
MLSSEILQVSGKPQYNEAEVIDAAMNAFWRHGYTATSINVLTESTGLSRSSLYQRFQDKDGLFQIVLATYTDRLMRRMHSAEGSTARASLEALLRGLLPMASPRPLGCLLSRSCAELVDLPAASQQAVLAGVNRQRDVLMNLLREALTAGELPAGTDIDALAWHFLGVMQAVVNFPLAGASPDALERMIAVAMLAWPEAAAMAQTES